MKLKESKDEYYLKIIKIEEISKKSSCLYISNISLVSMIHAEHVMIYKMMEYMLDSILVDMRKYRYNLAEMMNFDVNIDELGIMKDVMKGVMNLNTVGVSDGNLKPSNILFDENGELVISDYCLNNLRNIDRIHNENSIYNSPELLNNKEIDKSCDIWSIGLLFYYLLTHGTLFISERDAHDNILEKIKQDNKLDSKYKKVIFSSIQIDKFKRPSIHELYEELNRIDNNNNNELLSSRPFLVVDNNIKLNNEMIECMIERYTINNMLRYITYNKRRSRELLCFLINIYWFKDEIDIFNYLLKCDSLTTTECLILLSTKEKYKMNMIKVNNVKANIEYLNYNKYFLNYLNSIKELSAIRMKIDIHTLSYISNSFQSMNNLQNLDLTQNNLNDSGMLELVKYYSFLNHLEVLNVSYNGISQIGLKYMIENNNNSLPLLRRLTLFGNLINDESIEEINEICNIFKSLIVIDLPIYVSDDRLCLMKKNNPHMIFITDY